MRLATKDIVKGRFFESFDCLLGYSERASQIEEIGFPLQRRVNLRQKFRQSRGDIPTTIYASSDIEILSSAHGSRQHPHVPPT